MTSLARHLRSPTTIAAIYLAFGIVWITVTDLAVFTVDADPTTTSLLQTVKGWAFVVGSAALIWGLVWAGYREHERTSARLDEALRQTSILHRILRHNLRNYCTVISGYVELVEGDVGPTNRGHLAVVEEQVNQLIEISDKSRSLSDIVLEDDPGLRRLDLRDTLAAIETAIVGEFPRASITTSAAAGAELETDPRLERALVEIVENAVVHGGGSNPSVEIAVRESDDDTVEITVADDGPGMPSIERDVLERGVETQLVHSEGLGLWIARTIVTRAEGTITVADREPRGTVVTLRLPRSPSAELPVATPMPAHA